MVRLTEERKRKKKIIPLITKTSGRFLEITDLKMYKKDSLKKKIVFMNCFKKF